MESHDGIERLVRYDHVFIFRIDCNTTNVLEHAAGPSDGQARSNLALIEYAPDTDIILGAVAAADTHGYEHHAARGIRGHQSRINIPSSALTLLAQRVNA